MESCLKGLEGVMSELPLFRDRQDAGNQLATVVGLELAGLGWDRLAKPIVYALPRGGLPVAEPIARSLGCPLDVIAAKKVTRPDNPELAIGAVTADGHVMRSRQEAFTLWQSGSWRDALQQAQVKAQKQLEQFAPSRPVVSPQGAVVLLVDDGIATGMTIAVAAQALRCQHPARLLICAPVAPRQLLTLLQQWSDRVIVLAAPEQFVSVSRFYGEFTQVEMAEAIACLDRQSGANKNMGKDQNPNAEQMI